MFNILFLFQYSLLNGFLLHRFFLKDQHFSWLEIITSSILLSWCLNSLAIYLLVRLFEMPFTKTFVIITSFSLTGLLSIRMLLKNQKL